jgi:hypothetical protein
MFPYPKGERRRRSVLKLWLILLLACIDPKDPLSNILSLNVAMSPALIGNTSSGNAEYREQRLGEQPLPHKSLSVEPGSVGRDKPFEALRSPHTHMSFCFPLVEAVV